MLAAERSASHTPDLVRLLLKHGADTNKSDQEGYTALMKAAYQQDVAIPRMLLDHGADVNARNHVGETAFFRAAAGAAWQTDSDGAIEKDVEKDHRKAYEVHRKRAETLTLLKSRGADPNACLYNAGSQDGCNVLLSVCSSKYLERRPGWMIMDHLLDLGVEINATDKQGKTALYHAVLGFLRLLFDGRYSDPGFPPCDHWSIAADLLKARGARLNQDTRNRLLLELAAEGKNVDTKAAADLLESMLFVAGEQ